MDAQSREIVTWTLGTLLSVLLFLGLATRYVLVPYLRDHLVRPVKETHQQVTENHHTNNNPTLPDRIEDLHTDIRTLTRLLDYHVAWSEREHRRIDNDLIDWKRRNRHD